ncbi:MAG: SDR family NAD(P)-dependent oxidoreductase [Candidatus Omnitrophica bacterium]|jgi:3-oxoacyl-[acyl-carrier protein] reductase|nr:SDR family NAD(P)-dependent oxidoreductase [Candidatus Omnitrophota bacterium]
MMKKKNALVTGASRGIGLAIADCFKKQGINVLAPGRKELDLLSKDSIANYLAGLKCPVDILVNNAGINMLGGIVSLEERNIQETIQVNLLAPLDIIRNVAPRMMHKKYGRILNIGSIWGLITKPGRVTYTLTKSGLGGLTRSMAVELAPYNVLVNCVAPGYVDTELTRKNNTSRELEKIKKSIPLQRLANPGEIAELAYFLCSDKNTYITGQTIAIDGGYLCV